MSFLKQASSEMSLFVTDAQTVMPEMLTMMAVLWAFNIVNWMTGSRLNILGILPRHPFGLIGIVFSPILHSNFNHLFFNSVPLFALGLFMMTLGLDVFCWATGLIAGLGGFAVWLVGRRGIHLGASALVSGYFSFIMLLAFEQPSFISILLASIALYYFGGILLSLFPTEERTSWEGHLCGFLAGLASMYLCAYWIF
ncbi:MAG: rhomboid family intramembrane serine protease [Gammaproteobacteria bacterium]